MVRVTPRFATARGYGPRPHMPSRRRRSASQQLSTVARAAPKPARQRRGGEPKCRDGQRQPQARRECMQGRVISRHRPRPVVSFPRPAPGPPACRAAGRPSLDWQPTPRCAAGCPPVSRYPMTPRRDNPGAAAPHAFGSPATLPQPRLLTLPACYIHFPDSLTRSRRCRGGGRWGQGGGPPARSPGRARNVFCV